MASVDLESRIEGVRPREEVGEPGLVWDGTVSSSPLGLGGDAEPVVLDWYGRGEPDLLVSTAGGGAGRTVRIYRPLAPGEGSAPEYDEGAVVEDLTGLRCICPLPNGSPGRFDLVALDGGMLVFLRRHGDESPPEFAPRQALGVPANLGLGFSRIVQMVAVDWDGDGLTDLLVGVDDLHGYWPDGDAVPVEQQVGFNQRGGHPGYDRSGNWRGRPPKGRLVWLRNVGRPGEPKFERPEPIESDAGNLVLANRPAPLAIAWGGRGTIELLVADASSEVRLFRNFGGQRPPVLMESRVLRAAGSRTPLLLPEDRTAVTAADLDGDRRPELLVGTATGRVFAVLPGGQRDEAIGPAPVLSRCRRVRLGGRSVIAAADLDGDGDQDLIVGDGLGQVWFVQDLGGPDHHRYALPVPLEAGGDPFRIEPAPDGVLGGPADLRLGHACPTVADWTGNGRPDVIVTGSDGEVRFLRNNGAATDPRFDSPRPLRCGGGPLILPPRVRPAAADWSGSGRFDLIALDLQGFLCVFPGGENLNLEPPVRLTDRFGRWIRLDGGFGQAGRCALWAGPWTGSGKIDLLVGLPRGARHIIPAACGRSFDDRAELPTVLLLENLGRNLLVPRPLYHADGRPVVVGDDGCSPCGVDWTGEGKLDLLVGSDDGQVVVYRRETLRWS